MPKQGFERMPGFGPGSSSRAPQPAQLEFPFTLQNLVIFATVVSKGSEEAAAQALRASNGLSHTSQL